MGKPRYTVSYSSQFCILPATGTSFLPIFSRLHLASGFVHLRSASLYGFSGLISNRSAETFTASSSATLLVVPAYALKNAIIDFIICPFLTSVTSVIVPFYHSFPMFSIFFSTSSKFICRHLSFNRLRNISGCLRLLPVYTVKSIHP